MSVLVLLRLAGLVGLLEADVAARRVLEATLTHQAKAGGVGSQHVVAEDPLDTSAGADPDIREIFPGAICADPAVQAGYV